MAIGAGRDIDIERSRTSHIGSYDERRKGFSWSLGERELGYKPGDVINIGWYCTDWIRRLGKAAKTALIHEGSSGTEKRYTYNDIRLASNTIGAFLRSLGLRDGERVCLFMDRIPELYLGFLAILKNGSPARLDGETVPRDHGHGPRSLQE